MLNLDLVITVDTMTAHLPGALGCPVWILLSFRADWRWMLDRRDTPWYPTATLFRQSRPGDWTPVLADVTDAPTRCESAVDSVPPSRAGNPSSPVLPIERPIG
jgi:hypothetical protein